METKTNPEQGEWDGFVGKQDQSQFLQSWAWGEFQKSTGRTVDRLLFLTEGKPWAAVQTITRTLPFGLKEFYIPRGPIIDPRLGVSDYQLTLERIIEELRNTAQHRGITVVRFEPALERHSPAGHLFVRLASWHPVEPRNPQQTLYLNLLVELSSLLENFHEKTRYNIRLAERKGVQSETSDHQEDMDIFLHLVHQTYRRQGIKPHPDSYYRALISVLGMAGMAKFFVARYKNHVVAANLVIHFGDTVTYLHGGSSDDFRNIMASHLLQWKQIVWAKEQGARWYDFYGIAPSDAQEHRWAGITRFKRGFGGEERHYLSGLELALRPVGYRALRLGRKILR